MQGKRVVCVGGGVSCVCACVGGLLCVGWWGGGGSCVCRGGGLVCPCVGWGWENGD